MRICTVSDSLTNTERDNWSRLVARDSGHEVFVEAHGGWTTRSYFKDRFNGVAFANVPDEVDLFILLIGSNNLFEDRGGSEASVSEACDGVVRLAEHLRRGSPAARFMLIAPPRIAPHRFNPPADAMPRRRIVPQTLGWLERLSRAYRRLAVERGWLFVDLFPLLDDAHLADVAHPTAEGNRLIADAVLAALPPGGSAALGGSASNSPDRAT